jgi:hypothetical protein
MRKDNLENEVKKELVRIETRRIGNREKSEAHGKFPKCQVDQRIKQSNIRKFP